MDKKTVLDTIVEVYKYTLDTLLKTYDHNTNQKKNSCYFCVLPGHWVQNCPMIPTSYNRHCIRCWEPDHRSNECRYNGAPTKPPWMDDETFKVFLEQRGGR